MQESVLRGSLIQRTTSPPNLISSLQGGAQGLEFPEQAETVETDHLLWDDLVTADPVFATR